ncbi:MAG: H(+)/Cl(-) exchange transporter ClcA [Spirochaetes bacterium ADurb.Bin269]|nr:MAG: H(+)/Cl(-) exchange transporter ClcA [Spirochaetes bacterium ADurb.Bin269]HQL33491.1 ClC family H(+)/Cl(-) exchange transporter [Treponemataceae bacterium]
MKKSSRLALYVAWHSKTGIVFRSIAVGILSGFFVLLFRLGLNRGEILRKHLYARLASAPPADLGPRIAVLAFALAGLGLLLGLISKKYPMIKGSGIPQIKGELLGKMSHSWLPELPLKLLSGIASIGAGLSLGREGPSVQMGAYIGKAFSKIVKPSAVEMRYLFISGASAGLAAAFNAPLAGVLFALEELHKHFSPLLLACAMGASAAGDLVSSSFFGLKPTFSFPPITPLPFDRFPWLVVLGMAAALGGDLFKRSLYGAQDLYKKLPVPDWTRPVLPLLVSIPVGFFLFEATGGGHELIEHLAVEQYALEAILALFAVKELFTALSYGAGTAGGIFLPLLACGALLGTAFGTLLCAGGFCTESEIVNFLILGMAAYFTAVVRAPVTGAVLILEMSGNLSHLGALVLACLSAQLTAGFIGSKPVYDALLHRQLCTARSCGSRCTDR